MIHYLLLERANPDGCGGSGGLSCLHLAVPFFFFSSGLSGVGFPFFCFVFFVFFFFKSFIHFVFCLGFLGTLGSLFEFILWKASFGLTLVLGLPRVPSGDVFCFLTWFCLIKVIFLFWALPKGRLDYFLFFGGFLGKSKLLLN